MTMQSIRTPTNTTVRALCEDVYSSMKLLPTDMAFAKKFPSVCDVMRDIHGRPALPEKALELGASLNAPDQPPEQLVVTRLLAIHKALMANRRHESEAGIFLTQSQDIQSAIHRDSAGLG